MKPHNPQAQFIHLLRLGWDLRNLGVCTSLVLPVTGPPVLEVMQAGRTRLRVMAVRRSREWVFTWRPWWAGIRWRGEWVCAEADNAADIIVAEAIA
ncbi:hypothetical protein [Planomonospora venezuelensis]|uniref:Uncharacterized protein n=1 Tax=Planomonospora venezuelensis TaxID=1999 RepID=A0A841DDH5_PLAVE|nr:hypothetical protein [Planomonospora venezuelensis]MBB5965366.1 hypothetical protein [Planomonospora venezuelensis]GIN05133.1 hypothetical protein Pve01_67910 [Planomonospora venezuelensis]